MIQNIKRNLLRAVAGLYVLGFLALPVLAASTSFAAAVSTDPNIQQNLCGGASKLQIGATDTCANNNTEDGVNELIGQIINIFSVIVGVVAVVMIIYGGFRYITSGGDSSKVGDAKNTILYAIIGLILVALAQFIVKFVLEKSISATA